MEWQKKLDELAKLQQTLHAYEHALGSIYLDSATVAPRGATLARSQTMGILTEKHYELLTGEETGALLAELETGNAGGAGDQAPESGNTSCGTLDEVRARQVGLLKEERDKLTRIPVEEFVEYSQLTNEAESVWYEAKGNNDYETFRPYLTKIIAFNRRFAGYKDASKPAYDVLLDEFEKGADQTMLDGFFASLREQVVPLLMRVKDRPIADGFLRGHFPEAKQRELSDELMRIMGLDREHFAIHTTEHPFTIGFNKYDVRITTHYHEDSLVSSLYSVLHEGGHGLYDHGVADEYQYTFLADGASMGMHESQSRFYENIIGRSEGFINFLWPALKRLFPGELNVSQRDFFRAVNRAQPSLIRIEADELTYSLHIMVRYELEKQLIAGTLSTHDLPDAWNRLYKEYLGVDVPSHSQGVLQDTHWSGGSFGYFPSYALGSAYGAQFAHFMGKDLNLEALAGEGNLEPITAWLREKIHRHGAMYTPKDLMMRVCGEAFDPKYYVAYLEKKMKDVYGV